MLVVVVVVVTELGDRSERIQKETGTHEPKSRLFSSRRATRNQACRRGCERKKACVSPGEP